MAFLIESFFVFRLRNKTNLNLKLKLKAQVRETILESVCRFVIRVKLDCGFKCIEEKETVAVR